MSDIEEAVKAEDPYHSVSRYLENALEAMDEARMQIATARCEMDNAHNLHSCSKTNIMVHQLYDLMLLVDDMGDAMTIMADEVLTDILKKYAALRQEAEEEKGE